MRICRDEMISISSKIVLNQPTQKFAIFKLNDIWQFDRELVWDQREGSSFFLGCVMWLCLVMIFLKIPKTRFLKKFITL